MIICTFSSRWRFPELGAPKMDGFYWNIPFFMDDLALTPFMIVGTWEPRLIYISERIGNAWTMLTTTG